MEYPDYINMQNDNPHWMECELAKGNDCVCLHLQEMAEDELADSLINEEIELRLREEEDQL